MRLIAMNLLRRGARALSGVALLGLAACTSVLHRAPVEDRAPGSKPAVQAAAPPVAPPTAAASAPEAPKPLPGIENAGKPGYYTVRPGDTLLRVGLETGQNWRDIQKWNNLDNPNVIEVGQVLRVFPPGQDPNAAVVRPVATPRAEPRALDAKPAAASGPTPAPGSTMPGPPTALVVPPAAVTPAPPAAPVARNDGGDDDVNWLWPANGNIVATFDEVRNKGLAISGKLGDPVLAAADGRVVYAGSGLRGYGNLVIIKHNTTYLTAYAHNQTLLVKEDQVVRRGQKIAEMGSSDADRVQLHFEIRRQGKPVDPARLLPSR